MQIIEEISVKDTYLIRNIVLRSDKPIESCYFEGDNLATTRHFGIFDVDKCVGIISIFQNKNNNFTSKLQFQIRGMAILPEFQNFGLGKKLMQHCESFLLDNNHAILWCNARENAVGFYEVLGYKKTGNPFMIAEIGVHYIMYKNANE